MYSFTFCIFNGLGHILRFFCCCLFFPRFLKAKNTKALTNLLPFFVLVFPSVVLVLHFGTCKCSVFSFFLCFLAFIYLFVYWLTDWSVFLSVLYSCTPCLFVCFIWDAKTLFMIPYSTSIHSNWKRSQDREVILSLHAVGLGYE